MLHFRTVLHPTDFSPQSDQAFQLACSLARDHGARVIVLHVLDMPALVEGGVMMAPPPSPSLEERESAQARLSQIRADDPALKIEHRLEEGMPATVIVRTAAESQSDLIVMGTHGRTGLARLLMGSVAENVLRDAQCPVLTVRAQK
jgi:nucleotide-binding universal stress UspA family protein